MAEQQFPVDSHLDSVVKRPQIKYYLLVMLDVRRDPRLSALLQFQRNTGVSSTSLSEQKSTLIYFTVSLWMKLLYEQNLNMVKTLDMVVFTARPWSRPVVGLITDQVFGSRHDATARNSRETVSRKCK